jgi:hypothetical protein
LSIFITSGLIGNITDISINQLRVSGHPFLHWKPETGNRKLHKNRTFVLNKEYSTEVRAGEDLLWGIMCGKSAENVRFLCGFCAIFQLDTKDELYSI